MRPRLALLIVSVFALVAWADPALADEPPIDEPPIDGAPAGAEPERRGIGGLTETIVGTSPAQTQGPLVQLGGGLEIYREHGVDIKGVRAPFTMHVGGLLQFDYAGFGDPTPALEAAAGERYESTWDIRRARVRVEGTILRALHYRARFNIDPTGGSAFQDLFLDWSRLYDEWDGFWPRVRLGQVKEPLSIEALTSSMWITFMEMAPPTQAFAPHRNAGVRLQASPFRQHVTWWFGAFAPSVDVLSEVDHEAGLALTGRVTWLALAPRNNPRRLLSLGAAGSWRFDVLQERFRTNSGVNAGPNMLDTGSFAAHDTQIYQGELVFVHDRFSAQTEVFYAHSEPKGSTPLDYYGWYGQLSYFLTRPGRKFNRHTAVIERVKPRRPVFGEGDRGEGGWEVAARYSYTDLVAASVNGGSAHQFNLGLNWYLTLHTRITLNYTANFVEDAYGDPTADGEIHLFGVRFQMEF